jgi:hypothetical protein
VGWSPYPCLVRFEGMDGNTSSGPPARQSNLATARDGLARLPKWTLVVAGWWGRSTTAPKRDWLCSSSASKPGSTGLEVRRPGRPYGPAGAAWGVGIRIGTLLASPQRDDGVTASLIQVPATGSDATAGGTTGMAGRAAGSRRSTGSEIQLMEMTKLSHPTPISSPARTSVGQ